MVMFGFAQQRPAVPLLRSQGYGMTGRHSCGAALDSTVHNRNALVPLCCHNIRHTTLGPADCDQLVCSFRRQHSKSDGGVPDQVDVVPVPNAQHSTR